MKFIQIFPGSKIIFEGDIIEQHDSNREIGLFKMIDIFKDKCETLILVAHVKDKQIRKNDEEMSEMSVDLAGKLSDIICGEADAIGYVYRDKNKTMISFEGGDNTIREARPLHLRGKKIEVAHSNENNELIVDMSKVFIDG